MMHNNNQQISKWSRFPLNNNNLNVFNNRQQNGEEDFVEDDLRSNISIQTNAFYIKQNELNRYNDGYNTKNNNKYRRFKNHDDAGYSDEPQKSNWKKLPYSDNLKHKIGQIKKYGVGRNGNKCRYIRYGTKTLQVDFEGNYIALYDGNINDWGIWFSDYIHRNFKYDLNVLSRIDLLGSSMICGVDFRNDDHGYWITKKICKHGWLNGLKYVIEKLKINHINDNFDLLFESVYYLHDDILKYLLIQTNFYKPFDILIKTNKYNETLWFCAENSLCKMINPGKGWLHLLQNIHYAPDLIRIIHDEKEQEEKKNNYYQDEGDNLEIDIMTQRLNNITFNEDKIVLSPYMIGNRLQMIDELSSSKNNIQFHLISCYYGLQVTIWNNKEFEDIHFYKPLGNQGKNMKIEYIPYKNNILSGYGLLRAPNHSQYHYLTVLKETQSVSLCPLINVYNNNINDNNNNVVDNSQLWKIEKVNVSNGIWMRIINKCGYKLIFSWTQKYKFHSHPLLTISNDVMNIDKFCRDIFCVTDNNKNTLYYQYYTKYKHIEQSDILAQKFGILINFQFWNLPNVANKFDIYKKKLKNIANIIQEYHKRHSNNKNIMITVD